MAIAAIESLLKDYSERFEQAYFTMMAAKLGISEVTEEVRSLIERLLKSMQSDALDYTQTFWILLKRWEERIHYQKVIINGLHNGVAI